MPPKRGFLAVGSRRRSVAALVALLGPAAILPILLSGTGTGQGTAATFEEFAPTPLVLPPTGGVASIAATARTDLPELSVVLELVPPGDGAPRVVPPRTLVPREPGVLSGRIDVPLPADGPSGWWTVRVREATAPTATGQTTVAVTGTTSARVLVLPDVPVAGIETAPWPQTGGDPGHTGRTVSIGPRAIDVVRWTLQAADRLPFHSPVVAADGTVYAVTWGGELYAVESDGGPHWPDPLRLGSQVQYPPAIGADGNVLVAVRTGNLYAVRPDGSLAWSARLSAGTTGGAPLSAPVVGPDGRIYILHEPWTLAILSSGGALVNQTPLAAPAGLTAGPETLPAPTEGPGVAVTSAGAAVVVSGSGLAVVAANGTVLDRIDCGCTPRSVSVPPGRDVALIGASAEVVAVSLTEGRVLWSTDELPGTSLTGIVWGPPAIDWNDLVYVVSEDHRLHVLTLEGTATGPGHVRTRDFAWPLRGPPVVDANGDVYFTDACRTVRSLSSSASFRWAFEIDWTSCSGLTAGIVLTRDGGLLWPAPDGALRMIGSNRLPVAAFTAVWDRDAYIFEATGSRDPDGAPLAYAWDFGDGSTAQGLSVRHRFSSSGKYVVKLTVSDSLSAASASEPLDVNLPPIPLVLDESRGLDVRFNASPTVDPEGDPVTFRWIVDGAERAEGPLIAFRADEARVFRIELVVSDPTHSAALEQLALAPARSDWDPLTLALYDGACPSGLCALPPSLALTEDNLVEALIVNGPSRSMRISGDFEAVPGGSATLDLAPGQQGFLHFRTGAAGGKNLVVETPGTGRPPTRIPVTVRPAPVVVTWSLIPPDGPLSVGSASDFLIRLEGASPAGEVAVRVGLRVGVEDRSVKRVTFPPGAPIEATVELPFTPEEAGELGVSAIVENLSPGLATFVPAAGETGRLQADVQHPSLVTTTTAYVARHPYLALAAGVAVTLALVLGVVGVRRMRAPPRTPLAAGRATPIADGDQTVASSLIPRKLDRFHIERTLGEGGFGRTYLAMDTVLERRIVLKELEHFGTGASRELLLHEAKTAANLSHPNVVVVHDVFQEGDRLLIVMEYVEAGTLAELVAKGPLDAKTTLTLFTDVLQGLSALHAAGIVHRDLKPSNILVTPDRVAKITDFGVAARLDGSGAPAGDAFVGTPRYMAPEQLAGEPPEPAADIYAAGAILYEMLTGKHHLGVGVQATPQASDLLLLRSNLPVPSLDRHLNAVLERALARDPARRFASARDFLDAMRRAR